MDIMPFLNSGVLRALGLALIAFAALIAHMFFGKDAAAFTANATQLLDGGLAVVVAGGIAVAGWFRARRANPPLTAAAQDHAVAILADQGKAVVATEPGVARSHWLAVAFATLMVVAMLHGCATEPVSAAQTPGQKAAALLGDFNLYEAASVSIGTNPMLAVSVRRGVLDAAIAAKPAADAAQHALATYRAVQQSLADGVSTPAELAQVSTALTALLSDLATVTENLHTVEKGATAP